MSIGLSTIEFNMNYSSYDVNKYFMLSLFMLLLVFISKFMYVCIYVCMVLCFVTSFSSVGWDGIYVCMYITVLVKFVLVYIRMGIMGVVGEGSLTYLPTSPLTFSTIEFNMNYSIYDINNSCYPSSSSPSWWFISEFMYVFLYGLVFRHFFFSSVGWDGIYVYNGFREVCICIYMGIMGRG